MRTIVSLILFFGLFPISSCFSQKQDWINLTYPQSGIIGKPVDKITNGDISWDLVTPFLSNAIIDQNESAESIEDYSNKFNEFITKYFTKNNTTLKRTKSYGLKIRSLNYKQIEQLRLGTKYVSDGIAADSVEITIGVKKSLDLNISKALNELSTNLNLNATEIIPKIIPILDSITYKSNDSTYYKAIIKNPNVYYKVKVVKFKSKSSSTDNKCLYFSSYDRNINNFPKTQKIKSGEITSPGIKPMFSDNSLASAEFALGAKNENGVLNLYIFSNKGTIGGQLEPLYLVPVVGIDNNKRHFLVRSYVAINMRKGGFLSPNRTKQAIISVEAKQIDENTIELINWEDNSYCQNARTIMRYPEFTFKYVKK